MKTLGILAALCMGASAFGQFRSFDAGSGGWNTTSNTSSWKGQAINLDVQSPTLTIIGMDAGVIRTLGTLLPAGGWRLHVKIWTNYDAGMSPVFGTLLSDQYCVSEFSVQASGAWGSLPAGQGWFLPRRVTVPTSAPVGVSYQFEVLSAGTWQVSSTAMPMLNDGNNGFPSSGPTRGTSAMPGSRGWYTGSALAGNFNSADYRVQTGNTKYQGLDFRLYTMCTGDQNFDLMVDDADFVFFAAAYDLLDCSDPSMPIGCPSDLNADGMVDDMDFVVFAAAYDALMCS